MYQSGYGAGIVGADGRASGSLGVRRTSPLADEDADVEYGGGGTRSYEPYGNIPPSGAVGAAGVREVVDYSNPPRQNSGYGYAISPVDGNAAVGLPGRVRARSSSWETNVMLDNARITHDAEEKRRSDASGVEPGSWLRSSVIGRSSSNRNSRADMDPFIEGELAAQAAYMSQFEDSETGLMGGGVTSPPIGSLSYSNDEVGDPRILRRSGSVSPVLARPPRPGPIPVIGDAKPSGSSSGTSSASGLATRSVSGLGVSTAPTTVENRRISFSLLPTMNPNAQVPPSAWTAADKGKGREMSTDIGSSSSVGHGDSSEVLVRPGQRSQSSLEVSSQGHGTKGVLQAASSQGHSTGSDEGKSHKSSSGSNLGTGTGSGSGSGGVHSSASQKGKGGKDASSSPEPGFFRLTKPSLSSLRAKFKIGSSSRSRSPSPPEPMTEQDQFAAGILLPSPTRSSFDVPPKRTSTSISLPTRTRPFSTFSTASIYSQAGSSNRHSLSNRDRAGSEEGNRMRGSWTSPPSPVLSFAQRKSPRRASQPGPMPNFPRPPPVSNLMLRSAVSNNVASSSSISGPSQSQTAFVPTLITIAPTPSPSAGGGTNNEGLLDPLLMLRLREQPSVSTIGLNDHEDYSRPFRAVSDYSTFFAVPFFANSFFVFAVGAKSSGQLDKRWVVQLGRVGRGGRGAWC